MERVAGRHLIQPPCYSRCTPELVALDHFHLDFKCLQGWILHNFPVQSVPDLGHPYIAKVLVDADAQDGASCVSESTHYLWSCDWAHWKNLSLSSSYLSFRYLHTLMRSPWDFPSPGWTASVLSVFPHKSDAPVPSWSLWPFATSSLQYVQASCVLRSQDCGML